MPTSSLTIIVWREESEVLLPVAMEVFPETTLVGGLARVLSCMPKTLAREAAVSIDCEAVPIGTSWPDWFSWFGELIASLPVCSNKWFCKVYKKIQWQSDYYKITISTIHIEVF